MGDVKVTSGRKRGEVVLKVLGVIPARAGSKGVKQKNSRMLAGRPLVAYSIEAAQLVPSVELHISSDDDQVITLARSYGIHSAYVRPAELSGDGVSTADTVLHLVEWLRAQGKTYDVISLFQPTSPFRAARDIQKSLDMISSGATSVVGVSRLSPHPSIAMRVAADGSWKSLVEPVAGVTRRQDQDDSYFALNGAIYSLRFDLFMKEKKFFLEESTLLKMSDENAIDIDTEIDFMCADLVMRQKLGN